MTRADAIAIAYLVTIVTFILALRFLSSPATARMGNLIGAAGMVIAVAATFAQAGLTHDLSILVVMALATPIGAFAARSVKMTAMPQMVALFNGVGGGAAALVALAEFHKLAPEAGRIAVDVGISTLLSALIGSLSFAGSIVAFAKLQELVSGRPIVYRGQQAVNGLLLLGTLAVAVSAADSAHEQDDRHDREARSADGRRKAGHECRVGRRGPRPGPMVKVRDVEHEPELGSQVGQEGQKRGRIGAAGNGDEQRAGAQQIVPACKGEDGRAQRRRDHGGWGRT